MKGQCIGSSNGEYTFIFSADEPEIGHDYIMESAITGTGAQNRAFHALTMEYWRSGMHSYDVKTYADFRDQIKKNLGEGFESFIYVEMHPFEERPIIKECNKIEEIPEYVKNDPYFKDLIRGKLKSWSDYTLKQRKRCIDNLITEVVSAGVNTKKFEEILKGMGTDAI